MRFTYDCACNAHRQMSFCRKLREITFAHLRQTSTPTDGDNRNTRIVHWRIECQRYILSFILSIRVVIFSPKLLYIYTFALIPNGILCVEMYIVHVRRNDTLRTRNKKMKWWMIIISGRYVRVMVVQFPGLKVSWLLNQYLIRIQ